MPALQSSNIPQTTVVTTSANFSDLPIVNGQVIYVKDTMQKYFDWDNNRLSFNEINNIQNSQKSAILQEGASNVGKIYYVTDTGEMCTISSDGTEWITINSKPSVVFVDVNLLDFPETGRRDAIYVNGSHLYRWDTEQSAYLEIAKDNFVWGSF